MRETISLFILSILMKLDSDKIVFVDAINTELFRLLTQSPPLPSLLSLYYICKCGDPDCN